MKLKKICILGSTGSVGTQTLQVIKNLEDTFEVTALAAGGSNLFLLQEQIKIFKPKFVAISDKEKAFKLKQLLKNDNTKIVAGTEGLVEVATLSEVDIVVAAISGIAGLIPTYNAIKKGKNIALANKETLVAAGKLVTDEANKKAVKLLPVDSEHSAIFQCIDQENTKAIENIILTASGGPLKDLTPEEIHNVTPEKALKHPNWDMGKKISIDSASMMNKGLEVIEAHWLFNVAYKDIEVVIHPQSLVHSMVRYVDQSIIAQLGVTDMRLAIQHALTWPERQKSFVDRLDLIKIKELTFLEPRWDDFPCLKLAFEAGKAGGNIPAALNGANEKAVELFLQKRIKFHQIPELVYKVMEKCQYIKDPSLEEILYTDSYARKEVKRILSGEV